LSPWTAHPCPYLTLSPLPRKCNRTSTFFYENSQDRSGGRGEMTKAERPPALRVRRRRHGRPSGDDRLECLLVRAPSRGPRGLDS
jgi:hypothetical protein